MKRALVLCLLAGCAGGPRKIPSSATAQERLAASEEVLRTAAGVTAALEIEAKGERSAFYKGTFQLLDGNRLLLSAEGTTEGTFTWVEFDTRDEGGVSRTVTLGPSASSHRDPPAPAARESLTLGLVRLGLFHHLSVLSKDAPLDNGHGGFDQRVKASEVQPGGGDVIDGAACTKVDFSVLVDGAKLGTASLCIADATGLPVSRASTLRLGGAEVTLTEKYVWQLPRPYY